MGKTNKFAAAASISRSTLAREDSSVWTKISLKWKSFLYGENVEGKQTNVDADNQERAKEQDRQGEEFADNQEQAQEQDRQGEKENWEKENDRLKMENARLKLEKARWMKQKVDIIETLQKLQHDPEAQKIGYDAVIAKWLVRWEAKDELSKILGNTYWLLSKKRGLGEVGEEFLKIVSGVDARESSDGIKSLLGYAANNSKKLEHIEQLIKKLAPPAVPQRRWPSQLHPPAEPQPSPTPEPQPSPPLVPMDTPVDPFDFSP